MWKEFSAKLFNKKESIEGILCTKDYLKLSKCNCFVTIKSDCNIQMLNSDICTYILKI